MFMAPEWITFQGARYRLGAKYKNADNVDWVKFKKTIDQLNRVHGSQHNADDVLDAALTWLQQDRFLVTKDFHDHLGFTTGKADPMSIYLYIYLTQVYGLHEYRLNGNLDRGKVTLISEPYFDMRSGRQT